MPRRQLLGPLVFAALILSFLALRSHDITSKLASRDFPEYWGAGRLLLLRQDPYNPTAFLAEHNLPVGQALVVRMPPWSLPLLLPLGLLPPFGAWLLWIALSVGSLLFAIHQFTDKRLSPRLRILGYLFPPVLCCLTVAQIGLILLLGIVLFLKLHPQRPFLAGAALLLPFAKPHLLVLFWIALLIWCLARRKWAVLGGFATAVIAATIVALVFDPAVFPHYQAMLHRAAIHREFIPSLPGVLRALFFKRAFWVQFAPLAAAAVWCVWYALRHRPQWDWRVHGMTVMVVSIATSPYGWFTDEAVLLPAILQAAAWIFASKTARWATRLATLAFVLATGLLLLMVLFLVPLSSGLYFWSSLVWLLWYVYGLRRRVRS